MYMPSQFEESRPEVLHQLIQAHPLGLLVTLDDAGLNGNHIPFEIDAAPGPLGTLRGHVARANPVWRAHGHPSLPGIEAMVAFQGPSLYISPAWYPSKAGTGKVVPTYNYIVVHGYGHLRSIDDPAWLRSFLERLTDRHESQRKNRDSGAVPWSVGDAPDDYVATQLKAIVGIELTLTRLIGKWKISQNRLPEDRAGVARHLREASGDDASEMANWMPDADR